MRVKIRLAGGSWYDDDRKLWEGVLEELPSPGNSVLLKDGEFNAAFKIVSTQVEISMPNSESYVLFVSPISKTDEDMVELYFSQKFTRETTTET